MADRTLSVGATLCAVAVAAGAFGAHALAERLDAVALGQWRTASAYLMYGGLGACVAALAGSTATAERRRLHRLSAWMLAVGGSIFACAVGSLALGGPRWFGAIAPIGGLGLIAGFVILAWAAASRR